MVGIGRYLPKTCAINGEVTPEQPSAWGAARTAIMLVPLVRTR
jgi:hypothetical protein